MSGASEGRRAVGHKTMEMVVAAGFFVLGAIVIMDSRRLGASWADDGPQAGYFPFYLGLIICVSSLVTFVQALRVRPERDRTFVERGQLRLVLSVFVPTVVYVALIKPLGIYVASIVFIAFFMRRMGRYPWWKIALVTIGVVGTFFLVFEVWFKLLLPKGPLEALFGFS